MSNQSYHRHLQKKLKEQNLILHELAQQLQQQQLNNKKLQQQIQQQLPILRKKQNDNKILIKQLKEKIKQLSMELQYIKTHPKKPAIETVNMGKKNQGSSIDRKSIFKQFINDNYPRYKDIVRKVLAFILHIQKHAEKQQKQRIDAGYEVIGNWMRRFLNFMLPNKTQNQKNESIAQHMLQKWKISEDKMKKLMQQANKCRQNQDKYLQQIQKLQASQVKLTATKRSLQSKIYAYQNSLQLKGAEFVVHLKKMLTNSDDIGQDQKKQINTIIQTFTELANRKNQKNSQKNIVEDDKNQKILAQTIKNQSQIIIKQMRGNSSVKIRKNAPILKKNIFGYYENPQLHNNQPSLSITKLLSHHKYIQTVPQDLSVITMRPVIKLAVVDGNIKPQRNRHCTNFYVRLNYNKQNKLQICTKVCINNLEPVWNDQFLLYQYTFPFFTLDVMNQSKGLKDYSIGNSKLQVTRTQIPKYVNIKNDGQYQGRVRFMITYPKGRIYQFIINSIKLIYPTSFAMPKDTLNVKISSNSNLSVNYQIGEKIKYFDDDYKGNNKFIIQDGSDGEIKVNFQNIKKKGTILLSDISLKQGQRQVNIMVGQNWFVLLQGVIFLIVSEQDEPQKIMQENEQDVGIHKYFSLIAQHPVVNVQYNNINLKQHIKLPLVFRFNDQINILKIYKQNSQKEEQKVSKNKQNKSQIASKELQLVQITPIVLPNTNLICLDHLQMKSKKKLLRAPPIVYQIKIKMVQGKLPVTLATEQVFFEKILADIQLKCGDRIFFVAGMDLLQNFYVTISRTFKSIGFVRFKIGYITHTNFLAQKQTKKPNQIINYKQLQTLDTGDHYVGIQLTTAYFPQYSSTADYSIIFEFGSGNQSSKKTGNMLEWREQYILPFNKNIKIKVMQFSMLNNKCVYDSEFKIEQRDLKLKCKFLNFGEKAKCYIYFGNVLSITDVYSLKVQKIEGQFLQNQDWIGNMDPYIKFTYLNRLIYCTQKLQEAGTNPVWKNDQFVALTAANFINLSVYDDDLIGKDDYLGQCTISIPDKPVTIIEGMLKKPKISDKQLGKLTLNGQFNRLVNVTPVHLKQEKINLPQSIYKIIIYKLQINKKLFTDQDVGYFTYKQNNNEDSILIRSTKFQRAQNKNNEKHDSIFVDFTVWIKQIGSNANIIIQIWKVIKSLFSSKTQNFASCNISLDNVKIIKTENAQIILKNNSKQGFIGTLYYVVQPIQNSRALFVKQIAYQTDENLILLSDTQDCISFNNCSKSKDNNLKKLLMYDEKLYALTEDQYNNYCQIYGNERIIKKKQFLQQKMKFIIKNIIDLSANEDGNALLQINYINPKQCKNQLNTPKLIFLTQSVQYRRLSHPIKNNNLKTYQPQKQNQFVKINHLIIKNTTTNKHILKNNIKLVLIIKWFNYELRIPVFGEGNSNLWINEKIMPIYQGKPQFIKLVEVVVKEDRAEEEYIQIVLQQPFLQITQNIESSKYKQYSNFYVSYKLLQINKSFTYNKNNLLLSCQILVIPSTLTLKLLRIPWMHIEFPSANMIYLNKTQLSICQKDNNCIQYQLQIKVNYKKRNKQILNQSDGYNSFINNILVYTAKKQDIIIEGRIIKFSNIRLPIITNIYNTQLIQNKFKYSQQQLQSIYTVTSLSCSLSIQLQQYKELKLISHCLKNIQDFTQIKLNDSVISAYIFTNKYNNKQLLTLYGQINLYSSKVTSKQGDSRFSNYCLTDKCILKIQELFVDFNDNFDNFDVDRQNLYVSCINSKTQSQRVFQMQLVDKDTKKYRIKAIKNGRGWYNNIVVSDPDGAMLIFRIEAIGKRGIIDRVLGKDSRVVIGSGSTILDKWQSSRIKSIKTQIKQYDKSNANNNNYTNLAYKSVGFINIKYKSQKIDNIENIQYSNWQINQIICQNIGKLLPKKIRLQCMMVQNNVKQQEQQLPFQILYGNLQEYPAFTYKLTESILLSTNKSIAQMRWPNNLDVHVYDDKYNIELGNFNMMQLQLHLIQHKNIDKQLQIPNNTIKYNRWYKPIGINHLVTSIIVGAVHDVQILNALVQDQHSDIPQQHIPNNNNDNDFKPNKPRQPTQLQILDKLSQTILQLTLFNFSHLLISNDYPLNIALQTSLRTIRKKSHKSNKQYKKYSVSNNNQQSSLYSVYVYEKEIYSTDCIIIICNKNGQPIYVGKLLASQAAQVGCITFCQVQNNNRICGTCVYRVQIPFQTKVTDIRQIPTFIQIANIQLQSYKDTQIFSQMTPFIVLNQLYISALSKGQADLFYTLGILLPASSRSATALTCKVVDKDLFFDDYIGSTFVYLQPFDTKLQILSSRMQKKQGKQHSVLKLGQYNHVWEDIKNQGQLVGRMKIQYRYVLAMPVAILYSSIRDDILIKIQQHLQDIKYAITKNRYRKAIRSYTEVGQQLTVVKINKINAQQFIGYNRLLMSQVQRYKDKSKKQKQSIYTNMHGVQLYNMNNDVIKRLGVSTNDSKQIALYMTIAYRQNDKMTIPLYKWLLQSSKKLPKQKYIPVPQITVPQNLITIPACYSQLIAMDSYTTMHYVSNFIIFLQQSKIKSDNILLIYLMTQQDTMVLIDNINAKIDIEGNSKKGIVIKITITDKVFVYRYGNKGDEQQLVENQMRVVIFDQQTEYKYSAHVSATKANMQIFTNNSITSTNSNYSNGYLLASKIHNIRDCRQQYEQTVGIIYININIVDSSSQYSIQQIRKQQNSIDFKKNQQILREIYANMPLQLPEKDNQILFKIKICSAVLVKDVQLLGKMDPYCQVYLRDMNNKKYTRKKQNRIYKTHVEQDKGKNPVWNQQFYIKLPYQAGLSAGRDKFRIQFAIRDQEVLIDRDIGYCSICVWDYTNQQSAMQSNKKNNIISIKLNQDQKQANKQAGDLLLEISQPITTYIVFTHMHTIIPLQKQNITLQYEEINSIQNINSKLSYLTQLPILSLNTLYPISPSTVAIKLIVHTNQQDFELKTFKINQLYEKMYRFNAKIKMHQTGIQFGYIIVEKNNLGNGSQYWKKWESLYTKILSLQKKQKEVFMNKKNGSDFLLQDEKEGRIKQDQGIFLLQQEKNQKQNKGQSIPTFILEYKNQQLSEKPLFLLQTPIQLPQNNQEKAQKQKNKNETPLLIQPIQIKDKNKNPINKPFSFKQKRFQNNKFN